jgi:hypothetical protein
MPALLALHDSRPDPEVSSMPALLALHDSRPDPEVSRPDPEVSRFKVIEIKPIQSTLCRNQHSQNRQLYQYRQNAVKPLRR